MLVCLVFLFVVCCVVLRVAFDCSVIVCLHVFRLCVVGVVLCCAWCVSIVCSCVCSLVLRLLNVFVFVVFCSALSCSYSLYGIPLVCVVGGVVCCLCVVFVLCLFVFSLWFTACVARCLCLCSMV